MLTFVLMLLISQLRDNCHRSRHHMFCPTNRQEKQWRDRVIKPYLSEISFKRKKESSQTDIFLCLTGHNGVPWPLLASREVNKVSGKGGIGLHDRIRPIMSYPLGCKIATATKLRVSNHFPFIWLLCCLVHTSS